MQMKAGEAIAYQKRHDESWPELVGLLHDTGILDYSIFLEEETHRLFAVLRRTIDHKMDALPQHQGDAALVEIHGRHYGDQFGRFASGYSVATHVSTRLSGMSMKNAIISDVRAFIPDQIGSHLSI